MERRGQHELQDKKGLDRIASAQAAQIRVRIILNEASGAALGGEGEDVFGQISERFREAGWRTGGEVVAPQHLQSAFEDAVQKRDCDVLVVAGGDGTIQSAARALAGSGIPLGIVPLGTFNQIARELGIPTDPAAAAECLSGALPEKIDVARVNGRVFLRTVLIGLPPKLTSGRQRLRGTPFRERLAGYYRLLRGIGAATRKISFVIDNGGGKRRVRALSVAVSNNPFAEDELFLRRASLSSGELGLYISKHRTGARMLAAYCKAFFGLWERDPQFERFTSRRVFIDSPRKRLLVSIDGETETLKTPLRFEIEPGALTVLRPSGTT